MPPVVVSTMLLVGLGAFALLVVPVEPPVLPVDPVLPAVPVDPVLPVVPPLAVVLEPLAGVSSAAATVPPNAAAQVCACFWRSGG